MHHPSFRLIIATVSVVICGRYADAAEPRLIDNRYKLERIATEPDIVTPIGLAFDRKGRLLVVESNTHQRPKDYKGPAGDRIRMLSDSHGDGKLDHWSTFAEGFQQAMNLLVREDGGVYVVTRRSVVLLRDTNNDGVADKQEVILRLDSKDDYPHNGLSGIALQPDHKTLLVSLGENHGMPYRLIGTDGSELAGKNGAGAIFQCTLEGRELKRVATGFWNPFGVCALPDGRIFAVDNDPDASPPCRLVHVVWDGDYGFKFQYGRAGTHPLQAWNGELPGTLPFVCGVGEAPTALVSHGGGLWATSWGDHCIDRYELTPRGVSYGAKRTTIVQGDTDFRPTGMAIAPDGSLYFGDWVLRDYPVHGRGRIWRLVLPADEVKKTIPATRSMTWSDVPLDFAASDKLMNSRDPFERMLGVERRARTIDHSAGMLERTSAAGARMGSLQANRNEDASKFINELKQALRDQSPDVRLYAVRWIADERVAELRDEVAKLLDSPPPNSRYYLAVLAAVDWLDHKPGLRTVGIHDELLVRELQNDKRSPQIHALALRLLSPDNHFLSLDRLRELLNAEDKSLRLEAVRTLAEQSNPSRAKLLAEVAVDETQSEQVCAEAIAGLAPFADQHPPAVILRVFVESKNPVLHREAERALRLALGTPQRDARPPATDIAAWSKLLAKPGDAESGRRLFFSQVGPRCSVCHKCDGRGGNVGPDLTQIGRSSTRDKVITSILQPSQEIAPDYQPWMLTTTDGKTYTGLRTPKPGDDGKEEYVDSAGRAFTLAGESIEERSAAKTSIMPENLQATLSIDDLRDLVTFLMSQSLHE